LALLRAQIENKVLRAFLDVQRECHPTPGLSSTDVESMVLADEELQHLVELDTVSCSLSPDVLLRSSSTTSTSEADTLSINAIWTLLQSHSTNMQSATHVREALNRLADLVHDDTSGPVFDKQGVLRMFKRL
jgi:hypothetical protein